MRIKEFVHYGTVNQLCERGINDGGNVRELVENAMIVSGKVKTEIKEEKKKMMLKQMMIKHHLMKLMYYLVMNFVVIIVQE